MSDAPQPSKGDAKLLDAIGHRLREERIRAGISQRELARRLGLSASLISQLEGGQSRPSVGTLYSIVTELGVSLDRIIRGTDFAEPADPEGGRSSDRSPVVHPGERATIDLDSGVRWEELSAAHEEDIDFLEAIYEVGGASTPDQSLMRHHGREYGYIVSGTLNIQIGFQEYELSPGDSIAFDSTTPHRFFNRGDVPVRAIWFVVGRAADHRSQE
ncbi:MAG TPA: cupin domain-containing protein [Actinomycetota bacterium]|nr:cupin domain-containing protein [Actinomycetota bacterium]